MLSLLFILDLLTSFLSYLISPYIFQSNHSVYLVSILDVRSLSLSVFSFAYSFFLSSAIYFSARCAVICHFQFLPCHGSLYLFPVFHFSLRLKGTFASFLFLPEFTLIFHSALLHSFISSINLEPFPLT